MHPTESSQQMHIIVQAGGRGSRMRHHTWNKPKCLVSYDGQSLLYRLFDRFPDCRFHIIGDYAYDQLERYLQVNPPEVQYTLMQAHGTGTCSGIADALVTIPKRDAVMIIWSDLVIGDIPDWPDCDHPVLVLTNKFNCRWTYHDHLDPKLIEKSGLNGVPGIFYCKHAGNFTIPPANGEFVKWFATQVREFSTVHCDDLTEVGDFDCIENNNSNRTASRFFNVVDIIDSAQVIKKAKMPEYQWLIDAEKDWYQEVNALGFSRIPKIYNHDPLCMEYIKGQHAYTLDDLSAREKRSILADYIDSLENLHRMGRKPAVSEDLFQVYIQKTKQRVSNIKMLIPGFDRPDITVNGCKCRNLFVNGCLDNLFDHISAEYFTPIHGDPTFSNSLIDHNLKVWYFDPRGHFHQRGIWGDPWYDFAKVYYSARGGFDSFNRRNFKLYIDDKTVEILQPTANFSDVADSVFQDFFDQDIRRIQILHGLIWLGLGDYVKDDIDSVIASFFLGLYWLEKSLQ